MSESPNKETIACGACRVAPFWMIWRNPIFLRYCRSRLRPTSFGVFLLLTLIVTSFTFFVAKAIGEGRVNLSAEDAVRVPIIPLLFVQGLILFLIATAQVAGSMTAEADEGVIDYQKLAPMTPLSKVLGYLFGLPVREYALFLATMPFTIWCFWKGNVPWVVGVQLYAIFLSSAVLYHVTGLVAGTVVKNRRWAFLISMGLVFLLYTVVPQISNFGLVYFKYLTLYPTVEELSIHLIPRDASAVVETAQALAPPAKFFNLDFPQSIFTALTQLAFTAAGLVMVWRRWNRNESNLLGKFGAWFIFAWLQLMLLGNAIPLIDTGHIFPSREFNRRFGMSFQSRFNWSPDEGEALAMISIYGLVSLALIWMLTLTITPSRDTQVRGWRRCRKLGKRGLGFFSDASAAFPWVLLMTATGFSGWYLFSRSLVECRWFPGNSLPLSEALAFLLVMWNGAILFHALLENKGKRALGMAVIFIGVVPAMIGGVLAIYDNDWLPTSAWLMGMSPAAAPFYAPQLSTPLADIPLVLTRALPMSFWFWQVLWFAASIKFLLDLYLARRRIAKGG